MKCRSILTNTYHTAGVSRGQVQNYQQLLNFIIVRGGLKVNNYDGNYDKTLATTTNVTRRVEMDMLVV